MKFLKSLADNSQDRSLANYFRTRRFRHFLELVDSLPRPLRILDLGGTVDFWRKMNFAPADDVSITLVNLESETVLLPGFTSIAGDACDLAQFKDGEFELVFSNSVIEHVGDFSRQAKMAAEVRRIGKHYFVQTPNRYFPLEPHFLFPFFSILPFGLRLFLVRHFDLGWYKKIPDRDLAREFLAHFRLLNHDELTRLFPGARIIAERCLGMTKSLMAVN